MVSGTFKSLLQLVSLLSDTESLEETSLSDIVIEGCMTAKLHAEDANTTIYVIHPFSLGSRPQTWFGTTMRISTLKNTTFRDFFGKNELAHDNQWGSKYKITEKFYIGKFSLHFKHVSYLTVKKWALQTRSDGEGDHTLFGFSTLTLLILQSHFSWRSRSFTLGIRKKPFSSSALRAVQPITQQEWTID